MEIKILGTRGEIEETAPWHTKHSGILVDKKFLMDLGEEAYLRYKPSFVVFTHFHPDHAFFVRRENELNQKIEAYAPEIPEDPEWVQKVNDVFEKDAYKFTPIPTIHSLKVKSQAYVVEKNGKRFLYTGDMAWMEKKYRKNLGQLDMVITEGSFFKKGGMIRRDKKSGKIYGHTGVPDLVRMFSEHTHHIVLMHFGEWFMENVPAARKKIREITPPEVKVEAARDGQEFNI